LAHDLHIQERVHFLGKQDRVNELLPLADLLIMPSELESFGLVALEAMACRVPSIATQVGGIPELIEDGVNGLLVTPSDVVGLEDALERLIRDPALRQRLAEAGRTRVMQAYDLNTNLIALAELFRHRLP